MQRYRPPENPDDEPTRMAGYGAPPGGGYSGAGAYYSEQPPAPPEPPEPPRTPWFLRPAALIGWGVLTAILIALLIWGINQLIREDSGPTAPGTTSSTTTTSPSPTTTESAAPAVTTTETPTPTTTDSTPPPATTTTTSTPPPATTTTGPATTATTTMTTMTTTDDSQPPSQITLPTIPTVINLPPGL